MCAGHSKERWVSILDSTFFYFWTPHLSVSTPHIASSPHFTLTSLKLYYAAWQFLIHSTYLVLVVGRREIADGLATIEQLAADKSELESSLDASREACEKLCQEKSDLSSELDASRSEYTTATSQLDVRNIRDISFL